MSEIIDAIPSNLDYFVEIFVKDIIHYGTLLTLSGLYFSDLYSILAAYAFSIQLKVTKTQIMLHIKGFIDPCKSKV